MQSPTSSIAGSCCRMGPGRYSRVPTASFSVYKPSRVPVELDAAYLRGKNAPSAKDMCEIYFHPAESDGWLNSRLTGCL